MPNLLKVGHDNQVSVFIAAASQPVEVKFDLIIGQKHVEWKTICKAGETRNATLTLPNEFPVGAGELIIIGTGGLQFKETRDVIVYDNRHVLLVQTSASTYRPRDTMEIRVVAMNENLMPIENGELIVEIYVNIHMSVLCFDKTFVCHFRMLLLNLSVNFHTFLFIGVNFPKKLIFLQSNKFRSYRNSSISNC